MLAIRRSQEFEEGILLSAHVTLTRQLDRHVDIIGCPSTRSPAHKAEGALSPNCAEPDHRPRAIWILILQMDHHFIILLLTLLIHRSYSLWPQPASVSSANNTLLLSNAFTIRSELKSTPSDLQGAIAKAEGFLKSDKLGRLIVGRGTSDIPTFEFAKALQSLTLRLNEGSTVQSIATEAVADLSERQEGYTMSIPSNGSVATLTANSTLGLLRGLTTFEQLWYDAGGQTYMVGAPMEVVDAPAYVCQNLPSACTLVDVGFNFQELQGFHARYRTKLVSRLIRFTNFSWPVIES